MQHWALAGNGATEQMCFDDEAGRAVPARGVTTTFRLPLKTFDQPPPITPATTPDRGGPFSLRERIILTYRYHGPWSIVYRLLTYVLRFTPLRHRVRRGLIARRDRTAINWYRRNGRPVTIVIPSYKDAEDVGHAGREICDGRPTGARVRIVVSDDASGPEHVAALRRIGGIEVIEAREWWLFGEREPR